VGGALRKVGALLDGVETHGFDRLIDHLRVDEEISRCGGKGQRRGRKGAEVTCQNMTGGPSVTM
jgi:hypothetical protein